MVAFSLGTCCTNSSLFMGLKRLVPLGVFDSVAIRLGSEQGSTQTNLYIYYLAKTTVHYYMKLYKQYLELTQKAADFSNAAAVLGWDQEVYMPSKGFAFRGRQLATLSAQAHEMMTSEAYGELLKAILDSSSLTEEALCNVQISWEDYEKNKRIPVSFVSQLTTQTTQCFSAWMDARQKNDYTLFAPQLDKMIALKRQQADYYGYQEHPYDALLDDYEKGATVSQLDAVFQQVQKQLKPLIASIAAKPIIDDHCFHRHYDRQKQFDFSMLVLRRMGYDFDAGRQDFSEHPFTTSFSPQDVRITTRVDENDFSSLLWSSIHEGGHALYEQGLPTEQYGLPLGMPASLSIHESQSRLWENGIGRSMNFWSYFYPQLQTLFPEPLQTVSLEQFYKSMNRVSPSLIRTEADELTYHFHVMIRYEIEKALLSNDLQAKDLSEVWNAYYQRHLGVTPTDDKNGVLQDVHWSHGSFGYFPTYSLGSFYAAQFLATAIESIPTITTDMAKGDFTQLLRWLRTNIHQHGRRYRSEALCQKVTGKPLDFNLFLNYAQEKYSAIYGLT